MFLSSWSQQIGLRFEAADWFLYSRNIRFKAYGKNVGYQEVVALLN